MAKLSEWFVKHWGTIIPIVLSIVAILFTALKDFILPKILKPTLKFTYEPKEPYKKAPVIINQMIWAFERFKIENIGKEVAKNCRCQIYMINDEKGKEIDLQGFHLNWANRPDQDGDFLRFERLNIAKGESEFVDLLHMRQDNTTKIFFNPYKNLPKGMTDNIPIDNYIIKVIISGDNFSPYIVSFNISKKLELNGFKVKLIDVERK